jgi:hypothetical protein
MRVPIILAALAALALPAIAGAKEISAVDVCGSDGCTRITARLALDIFAQGSELAAAAPAGRQRSYLVRVRVRDEAGHSQLGWTSLLLPDADVIAFDDGRPGATFMPVGPALERVLRRAARGLHARAPGRRIAHPLPAARVAEVVPAPPARPAKASSSGPPVLAWTGLATIVLIAAGALRVRRR